MRQGMRPGGLTALAVLNFVFGALNALSLLGTLLILGIKPHLDDPEFQKAMAELPEESILLLVLLLGAVSTGLMIVAGVGYLKQRRIMGRFLGNMYALLALVGIVVTVAWAPGQFGLISLIGAVYPLLTLILINTTFKHDFPD